MGRGCEKREEGGEGEGGGGKMGYEEGGRRRGERGRRVREREEPILGWNDTLFKKKPVFLGTINYISKRK